MALILMRHLPGVGPLEWRVNQKGWDDWSEDRCHELAEELFGVSEYDIELDDTHFPTLRMFRDESDAYWAGHGWDVTDGEGKQLAVMEYLTKPLVCVVEKLHPDARYVASVDDWAARLEEDAKRFRPKR